LIDPTGVKTDDGYIRWFYAISHPCVITPSEDVHILRPPEQDALNEIAIEKQGDTQD
jgi:hypothetical protein